MIDPARSNDVDPVVEVSGLTKRYGDRTAVDDLSFEVRPGEVFALLGPNGAGKTTTVEILEGFRRPDAGRVRVLGLGPRGDDRELRQRVAAMPQGGDLYPGIRPEEVLRLFARFYDDPEDPEILLRRLGLTDVRRTPFRRLSGGEAQRLSLALALVGRPEIAFLDEPTSGMDVHGRQTTWEVIGELRGRGTTVLLTTHFLEEAERLADRVAIIHRGRLVALGTPRELAAGPGEIRFRTSAPIADPGSLGAALGATVDRVPPDTYRLSGPPPSPELLAGLTSALAERGLLLTELLVGRRTLEEVFVELTPEEPR